MGKREAPIDLGAFLLRSRNSLPAPGTEIEARGYLPAAAQASLLRPGRKGTRLRPARLIKYSAAPAALEKLLSPLNRDEGNEEEADIMVQPFEPRRGQTTVGTDPRLVIHFHFPRLDSADEKEEGASPPYSLILPTRNHPL